MRFVSHNPRFRRRLAASNPALAGKLFSGRLAFDALGEVDPAGTDPNDLPAWPDEQPPIDQLRTALEEQGLFPDDVKRALRIVSGDENDANDVRQELDPLNRLLTWLRDEKGIGDAAVAAIEQLLTNEDDLSEVGEAVMAADGAFARRRGARNYSGEGNMDYLELRRAERDTGIDIVALDSVSGASDVYRAALEAAGVSTRGIYSLAALKGMHSMLLRRQAGGAQPFAADSAVGDGKWLEEFGIGA